MGLKKCSFGKMCEVAQVFWLHGKAVIDGRVIRNSIPEEMSKVDGESWLDALIRELKEEGED